MDDKIRNDMETIDGFSDYLRQLSAYRISRLEPHLVALKQQVDEILKSIKYVNLSIQTRNGADYVYCNWRDDGVTKVKYIGRFYFEADRIRLRTLLRQPTSHDFQLSRRQKRNAAERGHDVKAGSYEALGLTVNYYYDETAFLQARADYERKLSGLTNPICKQLGIVNINGAEFLSHMVTRGFVLRKNY